jgi:hypothetical protein
MEHAEAPSSSAGLIFLAAERRLLVARPFKAGKGTIESAGVAERRLPVPFRNPQVVR